MSLRDGVCSLDGYEPACRACACVCGKGILRRDLRYTSPGKRRSQLEAGTHESAKTHAGNVYMICDLDL